MANIVAYDEGKYLRLVRLSRFMRQIDLSLKTDISPSRISLYERGLIQLHEHEIERILGALGLRRDTSQPANR